MTIEPYKDLQEAFNKAYSGLASQDFEESFNGITCVYRGDNGLKCAIGHLIPDEMVTAAINGEGIRGVLETVEADGNNDWTNLFQNLNVDDLEDLQGCHDLSTDPTAMQELLHDFAATHNLTVPEL